MGMREGSSLDNMIRKDFSEDVTFRLRPEGCNVTQAKGWGMVL